MSDFEKISSLQNPRIKNLRKLEKHGERKEQNLILIEGIREIALAQRAGYHFEALFICDEFLRSSPEYSLEKLLLTDIRKSYVSSQVYEAIAYRGSTEGVIATAIPRNLELKNLKLSATPLILVIEAIEKPGNLGAMLRSCDAAGADAVIICDARTDVYNPNVIRSSLGTIFTNQIAVCETQDAIQFLKEQAIITYAAELSAGKYHYQQNFKNPTAIVVGTEADGLSEKWMNAADERIKIPMLGEIDSLNVSVSAAVLLFEAVRQRSL